MPPPWKKAKREATRTAPVIPHEDVQNNTPCHLLRLPVEILAEMLSYTRIPDLLSLARTSKYFCRMLCDPASSCIWRRTRIDPDFLFVIPDPPPNMPEPAYAAMIFDPGKCCFCEKKTNRMLSCYASRSRLCYAPACTRRWEDVHSFWASVAGDKFTTIADQTVFLRTAFEETDESLLNLLALCASVHLVPLEISIYGPGSPHAKYLTEQLKPAIRAFARKYFQVKGDPQAVDALISEYNVQKEIQSQRHQQFQRLDSWTRKYEGLRKQINREHLRHFQAFAAEHCLQISYMEKSVTFMRVKDLCLSRLEEPTLEVMEPYIERIIEETDVITERYERRAQERRLSTRRQDIKNYWKDHAAPILPNLTVFRSLPILHALQHKDGAESIQDDLQSEAITTSVHDQLEQWLKRARDDLMKLLGYGKGEGLKHHRPQVSKLHPLESATALFQCKECKRVDSRYGRMAALDFKGLCLHECIQPAKSKADRTKWSTSNFELASNAIATVRVVLDALGRAENMTSLGDLKDEWFRCKLCPYGVRDMVFEDLLRHCQRHTTCSVTHTGGKNHRPELEEPARRRYKFAELKSGDHEREVRRHQFACAHCRFRNAQTNAGARPTWVEVEDPKRMDFNALRCHLATRHRVHDVRNEDYYWLPWDESMEPSEKQRKKAKKAVPPPPTVPEPGPVEEDTVPDTVNLLQKRRVHAKQHFCKHCPEGPTSSASPRRFDWQGLTAHMKARHSIARPVDAIDYEVRDRDQSPSGVCMPTRG